MFACQLHNFNNIIVTTCKDTKPCCCYFESRRRRKSMKNTRMWALKLWELLSGRDDFDLLVVSDLLRADLGHNYTARSEVLWGGLCWINKNHLWPITDPHSFRLEWWASGGTSNAFLRRCLLLPSSNEKILYSGLFYDTMKQFCRQVIAQQRKLGGNPKTWPIGVIKQD